MIINFAQEQAYLLFLSEHKFALIKKERDFGSRIIRLQTSTTSELYIWSFPAAS